MGITYETQSEQGFCRIRLKMAETYAWKGFEYDLPHVAEPVPVRAVINSFIITLIPSIEALDCSRLYSRRD